MRYRCIIVDDEPNAINILSKYVAAVPILELCGTCTNGLQALDVLFGKKIDLIFLDIEMPGLQGTMLVKSLQNPPAVIFTTAHNHFAAEAFDLDALDYLIKPVSFERFLKAINKLPRNFSEGNEIVGLMSNYLYFRSGRKMVKVLFDNILYIECLKDYIIIHRNNAPEVRVKQAFNTLEAILPRHLFLRIHRSFIVSKPKITAFSRDFVEIGSLEIPIGRKYKEVTAALEED
ncbi:two component transcriptional regulator, LytTR family [Salinimicrobium sediminis]|uniref:Two component transcriptional regulator, LytTR family n=1 Tax=Salinimicrobium sediminis TaxID=1343891 RepID=A0A285X8D8_9FLAO|nr:response regulator transcription factor [Salinimicrobium sediminis]SOC81054.1 two component transcriptional regulator, LytTR family [Salinimicrobium sediminis]